MRGADVRFASALSALVLLGLLPGRRGALDAVGLLVWCAFVLPTGALAWSASGRRTRWGLCIPALVGGLALAAAQRFGARPVPAPLPAWTFLVGLALAGAGIGRWLARRASTVGPARAASALVLGFLFLAAVPRLGGLAAPGESLARAAPGAARVALALSPEGWVLEAAGWDWTHRDTAVYATSGVEWFPRRPRAPWHLALGALGGGALLFLAAGAHRCPPRAA